MLGAVMFGHQQFQPVIDAIIKLAEKAAKEPLRDLVVTDNSAIERRFSVSPSRTYLPGHFDRAQARSPGRSRGSQEEGDGALL